MKRILLIFTLFVSLLSCEGQVPSIGVMIPVINDVSGGQIKYGCLYNWYAVDPATTGTYITAEGWSIPTNSQLTYLSTYLGGNTISGGKLKETGFIYWSEPNTDATNEAGFNARGSGYRSNTSGAFSQINEITYLVSSDYYGSNAYAKQISYSSAGIVNRLLSKNYGYAVRPKKDATTLSDGESGIYIGNDGTVYRTICIGPYEFVADNLIETKYRNGTDIPIVTDGATWSTITTGARCFYNNDESNK